MRTFVIGDLQGCFDDLKRLLAHIDYQPEQDQLWFVGDIINRGPQSLECLRFVKQTVEANRGKMVLGNHDFHLLSAYSGLEKYLSKSDTLEPIFQADDLQELIDWLRAQPLMIQHPEHQAVMVHAGIPPQWTIKQALSYADEVHQHLQGEHWQSFLREHLFGNQSDTWHCELQGWQRIRYIVNAFVRMRYCDAQGQLDFKNKSTPKGDDSSKAAQFKPWFKWSERVNTDFEIFFGHWSTLGEIDDYQIHATDTGCLWGGKLTAYCIEEHKRYCVACEQKRKPKKHKKKDKAK